MQTLVYVEAAFSLLLSTTNLALIPFIFYRKSLKSIWNDSPPLAILFLSDIVSCLQRVLFAAAFLCLQHDVFPSANTHQVLNMLNLFGLCATVTYFCATIAIVLQRIYILLFPARSIRMFNSVLVSLILTVATALSTSIFAVNTDNIVVLPVVPEGCYSFSCTSASKGIGKTIGVHIRFALSVVTVILGTIFLVLFKVRKIVFHAKAAKLFQYTKSLFYLRIIFVIIPSLVDVIILGKLGKSLSAYIGLYSLLGVTLDHFISCLRYVIVMNLAGHRKVNYAT